jgi:hypothetical protein
VSVCVFVSVCVCVCVCVFVCVQTLGLNPQWVQTLGAEPWG